MKNKLIFIIIFIILLISLEGCHVHSNINEYTISDECVLVYSAIVGGRLIRYDLTNRRASVCCPDPLCDHGDSCPVSNIITYCVDNNYIVFSKGNFNSPLYCFDLENFNIKKIIDCQSCQTPKICGSFVFFSAAQIEYDDDGKPVSRIWNVYKYDMVNDDLLKLSKEPLDDDYGIIPIEFTNDRILWYSPPHYYTSDMDYENISNIDYKMTIGDYDYNNEVIREENGSFYYNFSRKDRNTGEIINVAHGVHSYRLDFNDNPQGMLFNSYHDGTNGNVLYYVNFDNLKVKSICVLPESYDLLDLYTNRSTHQYADNYVGVYVKRSEDELENALLYGETMLFVNINTGEYFVISP